MQLLEDHIRREGKVAPGNVLRVDGFLNHQIDVVLLTKLAEEFHTRFSGERWIKSSPLKPPASPSAALSRSSSAFRWSLPKIPLFQSAR